MLTNERTKHRQNCICGPMLNLVSVRIFIQLVSVSLILGLSRPFNRLFSFIPETVFDQMNIKSSEHQVTFNR